MKISIGTYVVQNNERLGPSTLVVTDGEEDTMSPNSRHQLLNEESQQCATDQSQVQVVDHEQGVQLQGSALLHELPATEDDDIVGDEKDGRRLEGGKRSDTLDKLEFAGRIADDLLEGLVKDRP